MNTTQGASVKICPKCVRFRCVCKPAASQVEKPKAVKPKVQKGKDVRHLQSRIPSLYRGFNVTGFTDSPHGNPTTPFPGNSEVGQIKLWAHRVRREYLIRNGVWITNEGLLYLLLRKFTRGEVIGALHYIEDARPM